MFKYLNINKRYLKIGICFILVFFILMNISQIAIVSGLSAFRSNKPIGTDSWELGGDGLYRRQVYEAGLDFESMANGDYVFGNAADSPEGVFFNSGQDSTTIKGTPQIINIDDSNKGLNVSFNPNGPFHMHYKTRNFSSSYSYEFNFKMKMTGGNWANLSLKDYKANMIKTSSGENADYSFTKSSAGEEFSFSVNSVPAPGVHIHIRLGAPSALLIDKIQIVAVAKYDVDGRKTLIKNNDLVNSKNSGAFESPTWSNGESVTSKGEFSVTQGTAAITNAEFNNSTHSKQSLKLEADSELVLQLTDRLKANTEYSIYFYGKPYEGGKLEFRLSGFKNDALYTYSNGDFVGHGPETLNWVENPEGLANLYNWLENLNITRNQWNGFRYDFTTGDDAQSSARASFKAIDAAVLLDDIYLIESSKLQIAPTLPSNDEISRGHRAILETGFQYLSWVNTDLSKQPTLDTLKEIGFTPQYIGRPGFSLTIHEQESARGLKWSSTLLPYGDSHISNVYQDDISAGQPTDEEWALGIIHSKEYGKGFLKDLYSVSIGDEEHYSDTLIQNIKSWFELMRLKYDNAEGRDTPIILHHNEVGGTPPANLRKLSSFNINMLRKYIRTAKPDMITYDLYFFKERWLKEAIGGTSVKFYNDLNRYRIASREGLDGTGQQPIPFGQYHYSWRTGPGLGGSFKRADGWYELTQSQINLYTFASLAFGAKWLSNFNYVENSPLYFFSDTKTDDNGNYQRYYLFDVYKEMIRQSKNIAPHLIRLVNDQVAVVQGSNKQVIDSVETVVPNSAPADNPVFSDFKENELNKKVFIDSIDVQNLGKENDGLNGDVFVSYFSQLPNLDAKYKDVFTSSDPRYFMLLNGLTSGIGLPAELQYGSSYETRQKITVTFDGVPAGAKLKKVSRASSEAPGSVVDVELLDGNKLVTTIGGGYSDLYYWELGTLNSSTTSSTIVERGLENLIEGDTKYNNNIPFRDFGGKTIKIGHIKGTDDIAPEPANGKQPSIIPSEYDVEIDVADYSDSIGNTTSIGERYFKQDLWEFRLQQIQRDNNVVLEFKEYEWTKDQFIEYVKNKKDGAQSIDMPHLMVVPEEWMWDSNGLIQNSTIVPLQDIATEDGNKIFNFDDRKWNDLYTNIAKDGDNIYSSAIDLYPNGIGLFLNKTKLSLFGNYPLYGAGSLYEKQKKGLWTLDELNKIIDVAIKNNFASQGFKLFTDNEYLIRQILASFGVNMKPTEFDADSDAYKKAIEFYYKLKNNNLLLEETQGTAEEKLDAQMLSFKNKEVLFLVAPYEKVAYKISDDNVLVDNTYRKVDIGSPNGDVYTYPEDGVFRVKKVKVPDAGKYLMGKDEWNFMLFPKVNASDSSHKSILDEVSFPVIPSFSSNDKDIIDAAFLFNQLLREYRGTTDLLDAIYRGGAKYPYERFREFRYGDNAKDVNTAIQISKTAGLADSIYSSGSFKSVLASAIKNNRTDYRNITKEVRAYIGRPIVRSDIFIDVKAESDLDISYGDSVTYNVNIIKNRSEDHIPITGTVNIKVNDQVYKSGLDISKAISFTLDKSILKVGENTIKVEYSGDENYTDKVTEVKNNVKKALLKVTSPNIQAYQYSELPTLSKDIIKISGFISGEDESVLTSNNLQPVYLENQKSDISGEFPIKIAGEIVSDNYSYEKVDSTLSILKVDLIEPSANPSQSSTISVNFTESGGPLGSGIASASDLRLIVSEPTNEDKMKLTAYSVGNINFSNNIMLNLSVYDIRQTKEIKALNSDVEIFLPYPDGSDKNDNFYVTHLVSGTTPEDVSVRKLDNGLAFSADSFSPFIIGWLKSEVKPGVIPDNPNLDANLGQNPPIIEEITPGKGEVTDGKNENTSTTEQPELDNNGKDDDKSGITVDKGDAKPDNNKDKNSNTNKDDTLYLPITLFVIGGTTSLLYYLYKKKSRKKQ